MENYKLVLPEHLNQYGYLFGGNLLKWVDEFAWIAASLEYAGCTFVTIGMDKVEFKRSVRGGSILRFHIERTKEGSTSVQYEVTVFRGNREEHLKDPVFATRVTLVRVDEKGRKMALPGKE